MNTQGTHRIYLRVGDHFIEPTLNEGQILMLNNFQNIYETNF